MRHIKFSLLLLLVIVARPALAQRVEPKHLTVARQLLAHLDLSNTDYEHGAPSVKFTPPCESHTDCSGFADALLAHTYGLEKDQFRQIFGSARPSAARYFEAITGQNGFRQIDRVQDMRAGDFLAVKYFTRKDNTGHVMLVADRPVRMTPAKQPLIPGTVQWEVAVIDSSESGHGPTDTRHKKGPDGKDHDGLGEGLLRIYSDGTGQVVGFAWSTLKGSKFKEPSDEQLVIGRLQLDNQ